jgi:hypothetical protein
MNHSGFGIARTTVDLPDLPRSPHLGTDIPSAPWYNTGKYHYTVLHGIIWFKRWRCPLENTKIWLPKKERKKSCSWHIFPSLRAKICKNKLYTIQWVLHAQYSLRNFNLKGHFSWKMNKTRVHKLPLKCGISPQKHETAISPMFKPSAPWYNTGIYHYTVLHGIIWFKRWRWPLENTKIWLPKKRRRKPCSWHIFLSLRAKICKNKLYTPQWVLHAQYSLRNFNLKGHFSWKMNRPEFTNYLWNAAFPLQKHETAISPMFKPSAPWFKTGLNH